MGRDTPAEPVLHLAAIAPEFVLNRTLRVHCPTRKDQDARLALKMLRAVDNLTPLVNTYG
jgi:hypothetical protein